MLTGEYDAKIVDRKTASLYGDIEEEIYIECPQCMNKIDDKILILKSPPMSLYKQQSSGKKSQYLS